MYINQVNIENYRGFKKFEVKLSKLTLIIGENDTGKTNFFSALSLPLSNNNISSNYKRLKISDVNTQAILEFYEAIINNLSNSVLLSKIPKVSVEIQIINPENEYEEALLSKWVTDDPSGEIYKIRYDFKPKVDTDLIDAVKALLIGITDINETKWFTLPIELYEYQIVSVNNQKQIPNNDLRKVTINRIDAERDDFSDSNTMKANSLLTKMLVNTLDNNEKSEIDKAYTTFFNAIENTETFKKIINLDADGFENFAQVIEDIECIPNLPNLKNILSNITLKTGQEFLYQKGLGERNLMYIIILFEFYKMKQDYFSLCCIEEPEAHLSVNNLRLATDFIFKSTQSSDGLLQTLISSHNPSVINKLKISNVVVFSGDMAINMQDCSENMSNYLRKRPNFDILKLLFANKLMLVEGPTEETLVNSFLSQDIATLHEFEVISIGQKGFKTFLDIWLIVNKDNSNKKIGIVRDFDNQQNAKNEHDQYDIDNTNICVRTTTGYTLENDLIATHNNKVLIAPIFDLDNNLSVDDVANHMIHSKAVSMLTLCDAMLRAEDPITIQPPNHIQEVMDFLS